MTTHTPGPWHMVETEPGIAAEMDVFVTTPRYAGGTALIARVVDADDAALIAAAPDLLAVLHWFLAQLADDTMDDMSALINGMETRTRAALAKAKGESK